MMRRKNERVELNLLSDRFGLDGTTRLGRGRFADVSKGGALYKEQNQLSAGESFMFSFELGNEKFFLEGEMLRAWFNKYDNWWRYAVKFKITDEKVQRLDHAISKYAANKKHAF